MTVRQSTITCIQITLCARLARAGAIQTVTPGDAAGPLQGGGEPRKIPVNIGGADTVKSDEETALEKSMVAMLDAPLLFAKRHSYTGIHIYDTFYKWPGGGGGGLYILENPAAPRGEWKIRALINETTPGTLGTGVDTHPDISPDAGKVIFCYMSSPDACTAIHEININGTGLHQLTDPSGLVKNYHGVKNGMHDISPTYLPDGRIVFLSTRPRGLVPCANEGVSILHVMNADGSDIHPISVNSETEFDPMILPDGRIIYGRWEYIDKTSRTAPKPAARLMSRTFTRASMASNAARPNGCALLKRRRVSWGTGYMDYPSMIQPVWDKHCINCHGGKNGFAGRLDLTGGWTEHFNISYENLVNRRETQLMPYLIYGIDCMNGTALYSVPLFKPRSFGSATAPLAKVIVSGHAGRIKGMTDVERDLVMAWIDSNGLYYGSWDYTPVTSVRSWPELCVDHADNRWYRIRQLLDDRKIARTASTTANYSPSCDASTHTRSSIGKETEMEVLVTRQEA